MTFTLDERIKIHNILAQHTYPKEQLGFFTMDDLIDLIQKAINQ